MAGSIQITGETIEELAITLQGQAPDSRALRHDAEGPCPRQELHAEGVGAHGQKKVIGRYLNTRTRAARSHSDRTISSWGQATPRVTARELDPSSE